MNTATTSPVLMKEPFLRAAGVCGLLILLTVSVGYMGPRSRSPTLTGPQTTLPPTSAR
jgi:hypothetical protein